MGRSNRATKRARVSDGQQAREAADATVYSVLNICFELAKVETLVRVASCSKRCKALVELFVQQNVQCLLPAAMQKAGELSRKTDHAKKLEWERVQKLIKWLCSMAGQQALAAQTGAVLGVRKVPVAVVQTVLEAGVQITTAELVAAARRRVEGLEVWVMKPFCSSLPPLVQALCGFNLVEIRQQLPTLQAAEVADMLHLAINNLQPSTSETLLAFLQNQQKQLTIKQQQLQRANQQQQKPGRAKQQQQVQQRMTTRRSVQRQQQHQTLEQEVQQLAQHVREVQQQLDSPELLEQLLQTALARRHTLVIASLCGMPAAARMPATAVAALLQRAVSHKAPLASSVDRCLQLAATVQLAPGTVVALLTLAVQRRNSHAVQQLAKQEVCQQLEADTVAGLMETSVQARDSTSLTHLCRLPGAQAISGSEIVPLLETAVLLRSHSLVHQLCALPGMATLGPAAALQLLTSAVQQGNSHVVAELARSAAGHAVGPAAAAQLLDAAIDAAGSSEGSFAVLCDSLPAAGGISPFSLCGLFNAAAKAPHSAFVQRLSQLVPAVEQLTPEHVVDLLDAALQHRTATAVGYILMLPAAHQIEAADAFQIMHRALQLNKPSAVLQLCNTLQPVLQQLAAAEIAQLLEAAMALGTQAWYAARALAQLPAAQQVPAATMTALLQAALRCGAPSEASQLLLQLQPAKELEAAVLTGLVRDAMLLDKMSIAAQLLRLQPAAAALEPAAVAELLQLLLGQIKASNYLLQCSYRCATAPETEAIYALCSLPAAQQIQPGIFSHILHDILHVPSRVGCGTTAPLLWLDKVVKLAPAQQLGPEHMTRLLQFAVTHQQWSLKALCSLAPASSLDAAAMEQLLVLAMQPSCAGAAAPPVPPNLQPTHNPPIVRLCRLAACRSLTPAAVARLLQMAVHQCREEAVKYLSRLEPAAKQIDTRTVVRLLRAAVQMPFGKGVHYLAQLPGARGMSPADVSGMMELNAEMNFCFDQSLATCLQKVVQQ